MSRKSAAESLTATWEVPMTFQVKLFSWEDQGNHLIILVRGAMDRAAYRQLFGEIEKVTQPLSECKVLVDFSDSTCGADGAEIEALVAELPLDNWPRGNKIALISGPNISTYHRLYFLRIALWARGLTVGVFHDTKVAIDWLADVISY
jgi:hypothetical protein